jgi:hypothetical protein
MKRACEICGSAIDNGAGICKACGTEYLEEGESKNLTYGDPLWGKIFFYLSELDDKKRKEIIDYIKNIWAGLEENTSQKLFSGQFDKTDGKSSKIILYGPYSSFLSLGENLFKSYGLAQFVNFSALSLDEIDRIQGYK